jgi:hypothetical protein
MILAVDSVVAILIAFFENLVGEQVAFQFTWRAVCFDVTEQLG